METINIKICSRCYQTKLITQFYKKKENKDNVQNWCKECDNKRHQLWRKNNPGYTAWSSKQQRLKNPEKMRQSVIKYAKSHREVRRKAVEKWAIKNRYKISAHKKVYYAIKIGKLIRKNCFCGKWAHAHHDDYNKPLDVIWLCPIHHKERHAKLLKVKL